MEVNFLTLIFDSGIKIHYGKMVFFFAKKDHKTHGWPSIHYLPRFIIVSVKISCFPNIFTFRKNNLHIIAKSSIPEKQDNGTDDARYYFPLLLGCLVLLVHDKFAIVIL